MGSLVVIGNFDGVHKGHQAVLGFAANAARERGLEPKLLTFYPHPATVLGRQSPPVLTSQIRKSELVRRVSPSIVFSQRTFDRAFAAQSPVEFAEALARDEKAKMVVVGQNFRFGKNRVGDYAELTRLGGVYGFEAYREELRGDTLGAWSSTRIRQAIRDGALTEAREMLGRFHMLSGVVERGKELGRTIGFPTANLGNVIEMLPPLGIYAVLVDRVRADGTAEALAQGAMSLGVNPTTDAGNEVKVEVYLLDTSLDLYGATLRVHLVKRLRSEKRFDSLDALKEGIAADVADTREALRDFGVDTALGSFG